MSSVYPKEYINAGQHYNNFVAKARKANRIDPVTANEMQKEIIDLCEKYHITCKRRFHFYSAEETMPCEHSGILRASEFMKVYNASQKTQDELKPMLKMKSENTLYDELLKKIPESTDVYSIRITGQDLHKLTEILNSPASSTDYQVEVIDHRIRITGMYDVATRNLRQAILNCGVTDEALKTLMPEINKLAVFVSTSTKVIVDN